MSTTEGRERNIPGGVNDNRTAEETVEKVSKDYSGEMEGQNVK